MTQAVHLRVRIQLPGAPGSSPLCQIIMALIIVLFVAFIFLWPHSDSK